MFLYGISLLVGIFQKQRGNKPNMKVYRTRTFFEKGQTFDCQADRMEQTEAGMRIIAFITKT